jgi:predicted glutamine amidotransferase
MCRLFGVVSATPLRPLPELLGADLESFAALSEVHCDGWGVAYWNQTDDLVVHKAPEAARDSPAFHTATARAYTQAAILHLRRASPGMARVTVNTHPFSAGSVAFAHNGYFSPRPAVDDILGETWRRTCTGDTDSERFFALVLAEMGHAGPVLALARAAARIVAVAEVLSLNTLLLTHQAVYAFAYYDEEVITAHDEEVASYALRFRRGPDKVVVASSGWVQSTPVWETMGNGDILEVRRGTLETILHRNQVPADHGAAAGRLSDPRKAPERPAQGP